MSGGKDDEIDSRDDPITQPFLFLQDKISADDMAKVEGIIQNAFPVGAMDARLRASVRQGVAASTAAAEARFHSAYPTAGKLVHS